MSTMINRILFDYDGTLILHDKENEGKQLCEILKITPEMHQEFSIRLKHLFETSFGREHYSGHRMTKELYYHILNEMMGPLEIFDITVQQLDEAICEKSKHNSKLMPSAHSVLEYLRSKGYEICILTNGFYDSQVASMKHHGIFDYIEKVYAWDDFYPKPDKRAFLRALAGTNPINNIMVGDDIKVDLVPAKACGIRTIGINLPNNKEHERHCISIGNLMDLMAIL